MTHIPPILTGDLVPEPTSDGSLTFFSEDFGEWFHSRAGARTEAQETYVQATGLVARASSSPVRVLDVCYGLGYNSAAALEALWQVNPGCQVELIALELDGRVPLRSLHHHHHQGWSPPVLNTLTLLANRQEVHTDTLTAQLLLGDARQTIQTVTDWQADFIFLDPFSPPHCPELWTVEFLAQVAHRLAPDGILATYSCAAAVRSALQKIGLYIGATTATGRKWPGTAARWQPDTLVPLSQQEIEHLETRAAVPHRDPTLRGTREEICDRRSQEQSVSALKPTSQWRKKWLPAKEKE
ncbi:hypothetical protein C7271_04690 [filamentous cyanobacterium CCP5]|nr:hypothetical protein C7271_04690 [filamentous cyanobacterium CCP5]